LTRYAQVAALAAQGKVAPDAAAAVAAIRVAEFDWSDDALMAAMAAGETDGISVMDDGVNGGDRKNLLLDGGAFDMVTWADVGYLGGAPQVESS
jgi:hypothetical protein